MLIKDLYLYFAQFVPIATLRKTFIYPDGSEYEAFSREVLTSESEFRIDGIDDFIFGIDEERVLKRISAVTGVFLFVEYSQIESRINEKVDRKDDSFHVAITVAHPVPTDRDQLSEAIWQDQTLEIISRIRATIREDWDALVWSKLLEISFPNRLQPFNAPHLNHSMGWTMECDFKGVDLA